MAARRNGYGNENGDDEADMTLPTVIDARPGMTNALEVRPPIQPQTLTWRGFRVPAQDHHGHSERMWVSIQPGHSRMLATALGSKFWPYRTVGDIIRHAVDRHIRWLEQIQPLPSVMSQVDAIMEVLREDEFQTDFRTMFEKLQTQVSIYVGMGANREARALVAKVKEFVQLMPVEDPWKKRYEDELEERFGHLIANARGVNLRDMATERGRGRGRYVDDPDDEDGDDD